MLRIRTKKNKNMIKLNYTKYMLHGNFRNIPRFLDPIRSQVVHMYNAKLHNIEKRIGESLWKREKERRKAQRKNRPNNSVEL